MRPDVDREDFWSIVFNGPILKSDAILVLCGEDGLSRATYATGLLADGAAPVIVLSGGKSGPDAKSARDLEPELWALGVSPDRIILEPESQNTYEQARNCVALCVEKQWRRVLLVASSYHLPRAVLTFIRAMQTAQCDETLHVLGLASFAPCWQSPPGCTLLRKELMHIERLKIDAYTEHVARYPDGLGYLCRWEMK